MWIFDTQPMLPDQAVILDAIIEDHQRHKPMADLHVVVSSCLKVQYNEKEAGIAADAMERITGENYDP